MTIDSLLRPVVNNCGLSRKIAKLIAATGISPDMLSLLALLSAAIAGLFFFIAGLRGDHPLLLVAGIFVAINAVLDTIDGVLAREAGIASKRGDFLDHVIDRYADMFIICGIIFGGYVNWETGLLAIIGILLTSYMGTQAQAVGLGRIYGGIMGRADRLLLIIGATILTWLYPHHYRILGYSFLGWSILIFAVLCNFTAIQRFFYVWRRLSP